MGNFPADGVEVLRGMTDRINNGGASSGPPRGGCGPLFLVILAIAGLLAFGGRTASNPGSSTPPPNPTRVPAQIPAPTHAPTPSPTLTDRLNPGQSLNPGHQLFSATGGYVLTLQRDGNLDLYAPNGHIVWASSTKGNTDAVLRMQTDGNLVLYTTDNQPLMMSNTPGNPDSTLILQGDGNLVLYAPGNRAIWWSNR